MMVFIKITDKFFKLNFDIRSSSFMAHKRPDDFSSILTSKIKYLVIFAIM